MLTKRQFEVYMSAVTTADPIREIAQQLGISYEAAKAHLHRIFNVMGVGTRLELMSQYHYRENHP